VHQETAASQQHTVNDQSDLFAQIATINPEDL